MNARHRTVAVAAALALGAAAAYLPSLSAGWVWDDANLVEPSPALQDLDGLRRAVSTDLYRQAAPRLEASPYWRPLALASFWLDSRLGDVPRALHLGNVLLHALAAALLALLLRRRLGDAGGLAVPAAAAAWWAFHPQNVEVVAWISCRYDLLAAVALLGFLALPARPGIARAALHGLLFLAGLLSKDGFGAMLLVVPVADWAERRPLREAWPRWAALGVAIAGWLGARAALGIGGFGLSAPLALVRPYLDALRIYLARAAIPPVLTLDHPYVPGGPLALAAGAAVLVLLVAAAVLWRRLAVPVAVFLAGLVPAAVAMTRFEEIPERYLYVPAIGLALLLGELAAAGLAARRPLLRAAAPAVLGLAAAAGLVRTELRLPDWRSDHDIFAAALRVNPDDAQANLQAALEAGRRGDWPEARRALEVAQRSAPRSGRIAEAYAWALLRGGDAVGALGQAERATTLAPFQPDAWYYRALASHRLGDHAGELAAIEQLLRISPDFPGARGARAVAACEVTGREDCLEASRRGELR